MGAQQATPSKDCKSTTGKLLLLGAGRAAIVDDEDIDGARTSLATRRRPSDKPTAPTAAPS